MCPRLHHALQVAGEDVDLNIELLPNVQVRYNPSAPFDFDANLNLMFSDALMIGAMYRYEDSIDGLIH